MDLKLVGLGLSCVPFHSGRELIEWVSKSVNLGQNWIEILEICNVVQVDDSIEVFGPKIELDLGEGSSIHDIGEPPVVVAGVAPTVVVEVGEESFVKFVEARVSVEKKEEDQAEGTRSAPVLEFAEKELGDQAVGAGDKPAHETMKKETGDMSVLMDVDEARTGDEPVLEVEELRTGKEPVSADMEMETGDMPVREMEVSDSRYEDFSGDDFEKGGVYA